eukprot:gnl/TRDRNA2_/TRDRNA2_27617_c0_seq1.p1 gnl/TRDRNA2_/TRDRNA2_27617_c0~~gnl/TRDRNA2_/TRDRNA2_27617_c0_seq1.p1  ORF type:complete len:284 (-),score=76.37 gnl/TRDRNA2_/TRDRNA2_27617_c0_seq1:93-872(-)
MASPNSELAQKLAKRRSAGEQVFEHAAVASSADAAAWTVVERKGSSFECAYEEMLRGPASESDAPAEAPLRSLAGSHSLVRPSISDADKDKSFERAFEAMLQGPVLEDDAFEEALARIRSFERSRRAAAAAPSQSPPVDVSQESPVVEPVERARSDSEVSSDSDTGSKREVARSSVRERFFALVQQGLDPNEAAARAIREAVEGAPSGSSPRPSVAVGGAPSGISPRDAEAEASVRRSCASSAKGEGKHGKKKAIAVVA